ncbi:centriole and centriolar satellite protein OFD1-like [Branchiostoma floridae x Branchiostoma japonicum]
MNSSREDSMSAEDLRQQLYHTFKERGLLDSLKSQLRNKLITELRSSGRSERVPRPVDIPEGGSLLHRAANSLVADHLQKCSYDYTLSVFLPESGISRDQLLTTSDFLQLLRVHPQSKVHKSLIGKLPGSSKGFLWQLLCELTTALPQGLTEDIGCQTDATTLPPSASLNDKLRSVDERFSVQRDQLAASSALTIEDRMLSYQRKVDERARSQVKQEVAHFKETELVRMKLEEKEKTRREMDAIRRELEQEYRTKSDALLVRERNAIERLQKQQEIQDKEMHAQRQAILEELETVRNREAQARREAEVNDRAVQIEQDKMKSLEENIHRREEAVRNIEETYEKRLNNEMMKYKLEVKGQYVKRLQEEEEREARNREEARRLAEERTAQTRVKEELRETTTRLKQLERDLEAKDRDMSYTTKQNQVLQERLREMGDLRHIKEEASLLQRDLDSANRKLAEMGNDHQQEKLKLEKVLQEERERASRPPADMLVLQAELQRERERLSQEKAVCEHQKQQIKNELDTEVSRSNELRRRHDEQTRLLNQTEREVADLRLALQQTQLALQNEIYRNPKPSVINSHRSSTPSSDDDLLRPSNSDLYMDTSLRKTRVDPALQLVGGYRSNRMSDRPGRSSRPDRSLGFIEETKQRFLELEREAENLEKTYQTYQQRMGNVPSLPRDPAQGIIGRHHTSPPRPVHHVSWAEPPQTRPATATGLGESYTSTIPSPIRGSDDHPRPLSSTPYRQDGRLHGNSSLGLSEVTTWSPEDTLGPSRTQRRREDDVPRESVRAPANPMTVDDLIARPGEPSVVVLPGSETDSERSASPPLHESTVLGAERGVMEPETDIPSPQPLPSQGPQDSRPVPSPRRQDTVPEMRQGERWSTLEMERPSQNWAQEDRRRQEEKERQEEEEREQREWEETMRKREERRKKEEDERKRQQRELERLQKLEEEKAEERRRQLHQEEERKRRQEEEQRRQEEERREEERERLEREEQKKKEKEEQEASQAKKEEEDAGIDPVMKQYMERLKRQKEEEKAKEAAAGSQSSISEQISVAEDLGSIEGGGSDDFEW